MDELRNQLHECVLTPPTDLHLYVCRASSPHHRALSEGPALSDIEPNTDLTSLLTSTQSATLAPTGPCEQVQEESKESPSANYVANNLEFHSFALQDYPNI